MENTREKFGAEGSQCPHMEFDMPVRRPRGDAGEAAKSRSYQSVIFKKLKI